MKLIITHFKLRKMLEPKLKEDEPMDTGEIPSEENNEEEGEIDDDGEVFWAEGKTGDKVLCDPTFYGLPPSSIQELKKLSRAKRFGIPVEEGRMALVNTALVSTLYKTLGIDEENERQYRFNVVHMRGTENMSTIDVHEYFKSYKPSYVEWINDVSCNIVWTDHFSATKALLNLSKEIKNLDKIRFNANPFRRELEFNTKEMVSTGLDAVDAREIEGAIPPGNWRFGVPSEKSKTILLRFATRSDKKQKFAEKNSEYYKKFGNPHFGNLPGIVSSSMRNEVFRHYKQRIFNYGENLQDKNKKNPWGFLAAAWGRQEDVNARIHMTETRHGPLITTDLRFSLYKKPADTLKRQMESDFQSSQSGNDHSRSKIPKMTMYADEEEKLGMSSLEAKKVPKGIVPYVEDLRQRINRSRKRKQLIEEELKNKRFRFSPGVPAIKGSDDGEEEYDLCDFNDGGGRIETETTMEGVKEYGEVGYGNEYDPDNDNKGGGDANADIDIDVDEDDDDDEEKGSSWALENYSDLRSSLTPGKKYKKTGDAKKPEKSKSNAKDKDGVDNDDEDGENEADDVDNDEDEIYDMDVNDRSPLQIEFENDDYFENESN